MAGGLLVEQSNSESWDLSRAVQVCSPLTSTFWMQHYPRDLLLKSMLPAAVFFQVSHSSPVLGKDRQLHQKREAIFCLRQRQRQPHPSSMLPQTLIVNKETSNWLRSFLTLISHPTFSLHALGLH